MSNKIQRANNQTSYVHKINIEPKNKERETEWEITRHRHDRDDWWEHRLVGSGSKRRKQPPASLIQWIGSPNGRIRWSFGEVPDLRDSDMDMPLQHLKIVSQSSLSVSLGLLGNKWGWKIEEEMEVLLSVFAVPKLQSALKWSFDSLHAWGCQVKQLKVFLINKSINL